MFFLSPYELLEGAIADFLGFGEKKHPATKSAVGRTLRGKESAYNQHVDNEIKYANRAKQAKGYRAQVNQERAEDAGRAAEELFLGKDNITSGCVSDLEKASKKISSVE